MEGADVSLDFFNTYFLKKEDFLFLTVARISKIVIFCERTWSSLRRWNNVCKKSGIHVHETRGIALHFEM